MKIYKDNTNKHLLRNENLNPPTPIFKTAIHERWYTNLAMKISSHFPVPDPYFQDNYKINHLAVEVWEDY